MRDTARFLRVVVVQLVVVVVMVVVVGRRDEGLVQGPTHAGRQQAVWHRLVIGRPVQTVVRQVQTAARSPRVRLQSQRQHDLSPVMTSSVNSLQTCRK